MRSIILVSHAPLIAAFLLLPTALWAQASEEPVQKLETVWEYDSGG